MSFLMEEPSFFDNSELGELKEPATTSSFSGGAYENFEQLRRAMIKALQIIVGHRLTPPASLQIAAKNIIFLVYDFDDNLTSSNFKKQNQLTKRILVQQQRRLKHIHNPKSHIALQLGNEYLKSLAEIEQETPLPCRKGNPNPYFVHQVYAIVYRHLQHEMHTRHIADILDMLGIYCSEQTINKTLTPATRNRIHRLVHKEFKDQKEQLSRLAQNQQAQTATPQPELSDTEKMIQVHAILQSISSDDFKAVADETLSAMQESMNAYGISLTE